MRFLVSPSFRFFGLSAGLLIFLVALQAAPAANGAALFKQNCSMCHGTDGKGFAALKTPDFTDLKWQASLKDKGIAEVIKDGKKGTTMPSFGDKLKDEEIQALVGYIRSFGSRKK
jgi:cytochrome c oxidase cbb3-type subunit 3